MRDALIGASFSPLVPVSSVAFRAWVGAGSRLVPFCVVVSTDPLPARRGGKGRNRLPSLRSVRM